MTEHTLERGVASRWADDGDRPNELPLEELVTRLELTDEYPYFRGVDTSMSIDRSAHSESPKPPPI